MRYPRVSTFAFPHAVNDRWRKRTRNEDGHGQCLRISFIKKKIFFDQTKPSSSSSHRARLFTSSGSSRGGRRARLEIDGRTKNSSGYNKHHLSRANPDGSLRRF